MVVLLLTACNDTKIELDDAEELAELCEAEEQSPLEETITFPEWTSGCAWTEDGNGDRQDAYFMARREELAEIDLPDDAAPCDLALDFSPEGESTRMDYDDNFVFTFDGVVLATSYAPLLDLLPVEGDYAVWDWDSVVGTPLSFDTTIPSWCLGEEEGESECTIPLPEQEGEMILSFGDAIVEDLAFLAYEEERYEFAFVALGDNDDTDCSHLEFSFTVEVPYVALE